MTAKGIPFRADVVLSFSSLVLALTSILLGTRVHYLDYLSFFNALALAILVSAAGGLLLSIGGAVTSRGRSLSSWMSLGLALLVLTAVLFDS